MSFPPSHSTTLGDLRRPCWHCPRFAGMLPDGSAARSTLPNAARVRSQPAWGCSGFEREVGADDEPGPPGGARSTPVLISRQAATPVQWAP